MIALCPEQQCSGCAACRNACPVGCIEMQPNAEGFSMPQIDAVRCTECGLCQSVCPVLCVTDLDRGDSPEVYACWHLDDQIRMESSSGGMFSVFAQLVLEKGGLVFGALLDDSQRLSHAAISHMDELGRLRKSKYVQSDIGQSYREARHYLEAGREVLFTGTPCQIAGLYGFLGKKRYCNLLTADFVCHGVPSPLVFESYRKYQEARNRSAIESFCFRDKLAGWTQPDLHIRFRNGRQYRESFVNEDPYSRAFLANICLRSSCHSCRYASTRRYGDVTLADFWGIGRTEPFPHDVGKGVSLVLLNSQAGSDSFEAMRGLFFAERRTLSEAVSGNGNLSRPTPMHPGRAAFFEQLHRIPFGKLVDRHVPRSDRFRYRLKKLLGPECVAMLRSLKARLS